jgi:hypothetical protein
MTSGYQPQTTSRRLSHLDFGDEVLTWPPAHTILLGSEPVVQILCSMATPFCVHFRSATSYHHSPTFEAPLQLLLLVCMRYPRSCGSL